ncbi:MAG: hypothetical protein NTU47_11280 [Ignavibacteriales bacterium]|nr:hypothetical protein [Ignavibacteriales bacterium]
MKNELVVLAKAAAFILFVVSCISCSKDNPADPSSQSVCFTVSGFNVSINHMWKNGRAQTENLQGQVSFSSAVSTAGESHNLDWTNIKNDYTIHVVTSFNVKIDGIDYSYPADKCK